MDIFEQTGKINISLMGLMGSGKTVIGREISNILNLEFYDTDSKIEQNVGKSINKIFNQNGEDYFRKKEEEICLKLLQKRRSIISLGGGSIINHEIREMIKQNSFSIYLKVDIDVLVKRLNNTKRRPLLNNINKKDTLLNLYEIRKKFYNKADLVIKNNFDKNDVVNKIISNINQK